VADPLNEGPLATLLIDLVNVDEQEVDMQTSQLRYDIPFLANRLLVITDWLRNQPGAGAALVAAAEVPRLVQAVVLRGGRPDLAGDTLERVDAPTLAIVGGNDPVVLELNCQAFARMKCVTALQVIPGASHLFEEVGALEEVAGLAGAWFTQELG
jgi:putative phosphoribosyl transferase